MPRHHWIRKLFAQHPSEARRPGRTRLRLEACEDRTVPSLTSVFQVDGNAMGGTPTSHDWDQVYSDKTSHTNLSGTGALQFSIDGTNSAADDTFANSPKDTQDVTSWRWGNKAVSAPKTDLAHGFAAAYQDSGYAATYGTTHTLLYVGTDRFASGSNSAISIWFLQHPIGLKADGTFVNKAGNTAETHVVGDLLLQASLGSTPSVTAYKWVGGANPLQAITLTASQEVHAISTAAVTVPWSFTDSSGSTSPLAQEFFEVGLDLNEVFKTTGENLPDFSSFIITTRTSTSQTATLNDFILGNVSTALNVAVTNTPDAASVKAGEPVGFTVTVSNAGIGNLQNVTLSDPLPASVTGWAITGPNPAGFVLTGNTLSLPAGISLPFATSISVHVTGATTAGSRPSISSTAVVGAQDEGSDFLSDNTATATITVLDSPTLASDDSYSTSEDTPKTVAAPGVLANDTDSEGDALQVASVNGSAANVGVSVATAHGSVRLNADGSFTYTPAADYNGPDSFTYRATDGSQVSNTATVSITVTPANDPPAAADDAYGVGEGGAVSPAAPGVLGNDSDPDGPSLSAVLVSGPAHASSFTLNADGSFSYTHDGSETLTDSFTYRATDGTALSNLATVTITVTPANDPPAVAVDSADGTTSITVNEGNTAVQTGTFSDVDSSGVTITATAGGVPFGTITQDGGASGTWTWTRPTTDELAATTVTITANDGQGGITTTTFYFTVLNVAPTIGMSTGSITLSPGDGFTRPGSFLDPGTDTWTGQVNYGDGGGLVSLPLAADRTFGLGHTYATAGTYTVTVTIDDGDGGVDTKTFQVIVSTPPKLTPVGPQTATKGTEKQITFNFTGAPSTAYTFSINWGDPSGAGNVQTGSAPTGGGGDGSFSGSHTYKHKGKYVVYVTLTDLFGNSTTINFEVTVN